MTRAWIVVLLAVLGCDEAAPDGTVLVVEIESSSTASQFGVLLAVHARGGASVATHLEAGTFEVAGLAGGAMVDACLPDATGARVFTSELAVTPQAGGALLSAALYASDDCSGSALETRLIVVAKPVATPLDAAPGDAP